MATRRTVEPKLRPELEAYRAAYEEPGSTFMGKDVSRCSGVPLPTVFGYIRRVGWTRNARSDVDVITTRNAEAYLGPWPAPTYSEEALRIVLARIDAVDLVRPQPPELAAAVMRPLSMVLAALDLRNKESMK